RIVLALEALTKVEEKIERPFVLEAQKSLIEGLGDLRELAVVPGHTGPVNSVVVTPDGARIVTGSEDGTARVWDAKTGAELFSFKGHAGAVPRGAGPPDGAPHRSRARGAH